MQTAPPAPLLPLDELNDIQMEALADDVHYDPQTLQHWEADEVRRFFDAGGIQYYCPKPCEAYDSLSWWMKFHATQPELLTRLHSLRRGIGKPLDNDECDLCIEAARIDEGMGLRKLLAVGLLQSMSILSSIGGPTSEQLLVKTFRTFNQVASPCSLPQAEETWHLREQI